MYKSIIVEGFDCMGKSTLIDKLSEAFPLKVYQAGGPPRNKEHAIQCCRDQLGRSNYGTIFDRVTPISNACYADKLDDTTYRTALTALCKTCIVIYCKTTWVNDDHVIKDHDTPEHIEYINRNRVDICKRYDTLMKCISKRTAVLYHDWRKDDVLRLMEHVQDLTGLREKDRS